MTPSPLIVYILYRDMRAYGLRENLYREAREKGIVFLRYRAEEGLDMALEENDLKVRFTDTVLRRKLEIRPDLLVLAAAIIPPKENPLAQQYKVTLNDDGFFMEAHAKLRPVDCATDGVFICGLAHEIYFCANSCSVRQKPGPWRQPPVHSEYIVFGLRIKQKPGFHFCMIPLTVYDASR